MSRRVRRRVARKGKQKVDDCPEIDESSSLIGNGGLDWTRLPDDTVIHLYSSLNYRDRASLSSTCRSWWNIGKSPCLWQVLDLRTHKCDDMAAASLASRCGDLQKLWFRGTEAAEAILKLRAKNLREICGDGCWNLTDSMLSVLVAKHEKLESLIIGPDYCGKISSQAIKSVAICCPKLQKLRLSGIGIHEVDAVAINALAKHCPDLTDIGFIDCRKVDEMALSNVVSVRFISVAGTTNIKWNVVAQQWSKLPHLIAVDASRTDISPPTVSKLFSLSSSLKVVCGLNCPFLEADPNFTFNKNHKGKALLAVFTNILREVANLVVDTPNGNENVFLEREGLNIRVRRINELLNWLEWIITTALLSISKNHPPGLNDFWLNQGTSLLLSFLQSPHQEVQERAAMALATFVVVDDENASIDSVRAEAVTRDRGIRVLLNLAQSWRSGLQSEAAKAIANLSVSAIVAKAVADEGGISILVDLARSLNRMVAEEAAGGLWNLSVREDHKGTIAEVGGLRVLVDLIFKWSSGGADVVLERAAGGLANLAADDKCSTKIASVGGVHALVTLARTCKVEGVQEQVARALSNLAAHGDSNNNNVAVGEEVGALEALLQLTGSPHEGVRQEAAGALWNLSFEDRNREAIAGAGGVETLVALAQACTNASHGLQERAAGALWGLSVSEPNSIAIGQEGGVAPLIRLAQSDVQDVHETAVGALWNLAFNPGNALRIVEEGGIPVLVRLCSSSGSKLARFMSALALSYMFDGRMEEIAAAQSGNASKGGNLDALRKMALRNVEAFVMSFCNSQALAAASASSVPAALTQVTESACIVEAGNLRCSGAEIGRFVGMLRNPSPVLKSCAAFALLQFTNPGGRHAHLHVELLQNAGAPRMLRGAAAAAGAPVEAKIFARIVLRNLEH